MRFPGISFAQCGFSIKDTFFWIALEKLMKNIFYLPNNISLEKAKELYRDQENRKHSAYLPYLYYDAEAVHKSHRSFKNLLENLQSSCTVILWDVNLISMPISVLSSLIAKLKHREIKIRILNPVFTLDPDSATCEHVLNLLEAFETKNKKPAKEVRMPEASEAEGQIRTKEGFGYKRVNQKVIAEIVKLRKLGYSVREIARECDVSVASAYKYSKGIPPIRREQIKERVKRNNKSFDLKKLKSLPKCEGRLNIIIGEFIRLQRSYQTKKNYFVDLEKFCAWAASKGHKVNEPDDITVNLGVLYKEEIERRYAPSVVRRFMTSLSVFLNYCVRLNYARSNQIGVIKLPVLPRHNVKTESISAEDLRKIIKTAYGKVLKCHDRKLMANFRNYLGLLLLSTGGMRIGALLSLRVKDVQTNAEGVTCLKLESKRSDTYSISIDERVAAVVKKYIYTYFKNHSDESFLFFSKKDDFTQPMTTSGFNNVFRKTIEAAGINPETRVIPHSFRTSYATLMFNQGITLRELSARLNHKNIAQTAAYIKVEKSKTACSWLEDVEGA